MNVVHIRPVHSRRFNAGTSERPRSLWTDMNAALALSSGMNARQLLRVGEIFQVGPMCRTRVWLVFGRPQIFPDLFPFCRNKTSKPVHRRMGYHVGKQNTSGPLAPIWELVLEMPSKRTPSADAGMRLAHRSLCSKRPRCFGVGNELR